MSELSDIQHFFRNSTVFLTGATGSIGKLVLEKLLRVCEVKNIYVLVRKKKEDDPGARFKNIFKSPAFDRLKKVEPNYIDKLYLIEGDCALPNLGLSDQDLETIKQNVECIIHCAATVRFDQKLSQATKINVRAVRDLLQIAKDIGSLKTFVHVSTAYSNSPQSEIEEIIHDSRIDGHKLITAIESLSDDLLIELQAKLLGDYPNTYAFTKQVAENMVRNEGKGLPICIVRPSIVIGTDKEPLPGFIDNIYGPTGIIVGTGVGILRCMVGDPDCVADFVPSDYVVNHILAAAWYTGTRPVEEPPRVMNLISAAENPLTYGHLLKCATGNVDKYCTLRCVWYPFIIMQKYVYVHHILSLFLHVIPAIIVDAAAMCVGKKPMLLKTYAKIDKLLEVLTYFATRQWKFSNGNTKLLMEEMKPKDRDMFNFDMSKLHWDDHLVKYSEGIRKYIINDPMDTIDAARQKLRVLTVIHYIVCILYSLLLFYIISSILKLFMMFFVSSK